MDDSLSLSWMFSATIDALYYVPIPKRVFWNEDTLLNP